MSKNSGPSHLIILTNKDNKRRKAKVGVAFKNPWGGFSLVLGPGVVLSEQTEEKYWINLVQTSEDMADEYGYHREIPFGDEKDGEKSSDGEESDIPIK